jgi:hypothetical protein
MQIKSLIQYFFDDFRQLLLGNTLESRILFQGENNIVNFCFVVI